MTTVTGSSADAVITVAAQCVDQQPPITESTDNRNYFSVSRCRYRHRRDTTRRLITGLQPQRKHRTLFVPVSHEATSDTTFKCILLNARSVCNKLSDSHHLLYTDLQCNILYNVIILTESWLNINVPNKSSFESKISSFESNKSRFESRISSFESKNSSFESRI